MLTGSIKTYIHKLKSNLVEVPSRSSNQYSKIRVKVTNSNFSNWILFITKNLFGSSDTTQLLIVSTWISTNNSKSQGVHVRRKFRSLLRDRYMNVLVYKHILIGILVDSDNREREDYMRQW